MIKFNKLVLMSSLDIGTKRKWLLIQLLQLGWFLLTYSSVKAIKIKIYTST